MSNGNTDVTTVYSYRFLFSLLFDQLTCEKVGFISFGIIILIYHDVYHIFLN